MARKKSPKLKTTEQQDQLEDYYFFQSPVYKINKPEFLTVVKAVAGDSVKTNRTEHGVNEIYPVVMSNDLATDPRMADFNNYVLQTAWGILDSQGYAMEHFGVGLSSVWAQEHNKFSGMDQHVHADGSQMIAFYFTEVPQGGCKLIVHDPRPGKVQIDLPYKDQRNITIGSSMVVIVPEVGDLFLVNAYVPHAFSKNETENPTTFLHINMFTAPNDKPTVCGIPEGPEII